jgi:hypothetical protein
VTYTLYRGQTKTGKPRYYFGRLDPGHRRPPLILFAKVEEVDPGRHQLGLHAFFPLGLQEKPHITCSPIDATGGRVQYG